MRRPWLLVLTVALAATACGRKGPPLPPLVRIPVPPSGVVATRRGGEVDIQLTVPGANTDGSRPANIQRVDIYAINGPLPNTEDAILKRGTKIASVDVKAPKDPNAAAEADEPEEDAEAPEGKGLDQGAKASVTDQLTPLDETAVPGETTGEDIRTYVGVGITTKGRPGHLSLRAAVPLGPAPAQPGAPRVTYTETEISIAWNPPPASVPPLLSSVYEVPPDEPAGRPAAGSPPLALAGAPATQPTKLNGAPVADTLVVDPRPGRLVWGARRCYVVTAVRQTVSSLVAESPFSPAACVTLADTFPPQSPKSVQAVPGEGMVSLIWDISPEADVAGYLVLRGNAPGGDLAPLTPEPVGEAHFEDRTAAPRRAFAYAIVAVDRAGNRSMPSARVEGVAR